MLSLLALCALQQQEPIVPITRPGLDGRGRDPWVFRCIFEDRTRMVIMAPAKDWWMAFNPETCAMHKVWQGQMDFHGKVWDFSQDNSRAEGRVFFASPSEIWKLSSERVPPGWTVTDVHWTKDGFVFDKDATLMSRAFSTESWQRIFLAFDETGRSARFHVVLRDEATKETLQWFDSATHVSSETDWQWNFKRIEKPSPATRVIISSPVAGKKLKNLRMYGDQPSWLDRSGRALAVRWKGYETVRQTKAAILHYDVVLTTGQVVQVDHRPELAVGGWSEKLTVRNLPRGSAIVLHRNGLSPQIKITSDLKLDGDAFLIQKNGTYVIQFAVQSQGKTDL